MGGDKWAVVTIGSLLDSGAITAHKDGNYGSQYPRVEEFGSVGIPFLTAKSLKDGKIDIDGAPRLSEQRANELPFGFVQPGDVLLSHNATIGRVAVVPKFEGRMLVGTSLTYFRVDPAKISPRYLAAYFSTSDFQNQLAAVMSFSTRNQVPITAQRRLYVSLPPLDEQGAIAHILGSLDDKLELNRRMNDTLEAMTRTIFTSWFIDFDPVHTNSAGSNDAITNELATLFPSTFVETEFGRVPSGWSVMTLEDLCRRVSMGPFGSDIKTDNFVDSGVPVIRGVNLKNGFVDNGFVYVTDGKADELRNANAFSEDIVITHRGTLGQVGMIPAQSRFPRYVVSQSQLVLSVDPNVATPRFVYEFLRSPNGQHQLLANTSQTGVPAIARPTTAVKAMTLTLPPMKLLKKFQKIVEPLAAKQIANEHQSRILASIRDTILPKLISWKIRFDCVERITEVDG
jgi:type I restriction enzyme S subunit